MMNMISASTRDWWLENEIAFCEALNNHIKMPVEMQSLEEFTPIMGDLMLQKDMYKHIRINIILTSLTSIKHFIAFLESAFKSKRPDILQWFTYITMYIINEYY